MKTIKSYLIILLPLWVTIGCIPDSTTELPENFQGTIQDVEQLYTKETVAAIKDLGLDINEGNTPPNIEGIWLASQASLIGTNRVGDVELGRIFADVQFSVANQDNDKLSLDFAAVELNGNFKSQESFISGSGNNFTIYLKVVNEDDNSTVLPVVAYTFSGSLNGDQISNLSWTLLILDDKGDPENIFIENNEGRRFVDLDGVSPKMSDYGAGDFDGSLASMKTVFPANAIDQIQQLGLEINEGNNPPSLGFNYYFDPLLIATTRGTRDENLVFHDIEMELKNQDNQILAIDFKADEGGDLLQGIRTFISGSGNDFTIYSKVFEYDPDETYQPLSLYIFSGSVNSSGQVSNFTYGNYMIDDREDLGAVYFEDDDARYFIDQGPTSKKSDVTERILEDGIEIQHTAKLLMGYQSNAINQ